MPALDERSTDDPIRPVIVIPPSIGWKSIASLCAAIVLSVGGGYLGLIHIIYDGLDKRISEVQTNVTNLNTEINSASKDAGAFKTLMDEAPELRKNIQDTHDLAIKVDGRLDNIEGQFKLINASVNDISNKVNSIDQRLGGGKK